MTGVTDSPDFPTTTGAYSTTAGGGYNAFVVSLTAPQPCPQGWQCDDIGGPTELGDQTLTNGVWTVGGAGTGIAGSADQFHDVSQSVEGDSSISARVTAQQNTDGCAQAGIMYRASTDPSDVTYGVVVSPACNSGSASIQVIARSAMSGTVTTVATVAASLPAYLKATRTGSTFTAYTSSDGTTWTPITNSSASLPAMPSNALVGLAVASQSATLLSKVTVDNVSLTGATDLSNLDTESGHYTQTVNSPSSPIDLQLFNSPAGVPDANGWQPISLTLGLSSSTGLLAPAAASLTNASGGVLNANPVSVTWEPAPVGDLALRSIATGLDVRLVLHNANASGPFTLALAPDPTTNMQLTQDPDGLIRALRPITDYGDDGVSPYVITQTEYLVQTPSATDSSTDPAAPANTGPVTSTLVSTAGITQYVTLAIDPAWLHDAHRVFPVVVDLPIATAHAAVNTGLFATVNSCAPNTPASPADLVVGVENGCAYHGEAYFDLSDLSSAVSNTAITSATLRLYTPNQTGSTGVQVYQNTAPTTGVDALHPPSWASAPPIVTGTVGVAQSGSAGSWQSWDVTNLVRQWLQNGATNGGLTLEGSETPIRFASAPLGSANAMPSIAPYLDITYAGTTSGTASVAAATTNGTAGPFNDNAQTIYGEAGTYTPDSPTDVNPNICASSTDNGVTCGAGQFRESAVKHYIGGQFIRFAVALACPQFVSDPNHPSGNSPTGGWWNTSAQNPTTVTDVQTGKQLTFYADPFEIGSLQEVLDAARYYGLTPILNVQPQEYCYKAMTPSLWYNQTQDLVSYLRTVVQYPTDAPIYFEIGNEPNLPANVHRYTDNATYGYSSIFSYAAHGLYAALSASSSPAYTRYRILTGGMIAPTARQDVALCGYPGGVDNFNSVGYVAGTNSNVLVAANAIRAAEANVPQAPTIYVPAQVLGVAVHPYGYTTSPGYYWRNYYTMPRIGYGGVCRDMAYMIETWTGRGKIVGGGSEPNINTQYLQGLPVVFTEINFSPARDNSTRPQDQQNWANDSGSYLVDLFTYLYDHNFFTGGNTRAASMSPLRVAWFRGADAPGNELGLYTQNGVNKNVTIPATSKNKIGKTIVTCKRSNPVVGSHSLAYDYYYMRTTSCY